MTSIDIATREGRAALRAICEAAPPGECHVNRCDNDDGSITWQVQSYAAPYDVYASMDDAEIPKARQIAEMFSVACAALPAALTLLDRLLAPVDTHKAMQDMRDSASNDGFSPVAIATIAAFVEPHVEREARLAREVERLTTIAEQQARALMERDAEIAEAHVVLDRAGALNHMIGTGLAEEQRATLAERINDVRQEFTDGAHDLSEANAEIERLRAELAAAREDERKNAAALCEQASDRFKCAARELDEPDARGRCAAKASELRTMAAYIARGDRAEQSGKGRTR